jgi:hypothetical protein
VVSGPAADFADSALGARSVGLAVAGVERTAGVADLADSSSAARFAGLAGVVRLVGLAGFCVIAIAILRRVRRRSSSTTMLFVCCQPTCVACIAFTGLGY